MSNMNDAALLNRANNDIRSVQFSAIELAAIASLATVAKEQKPPAEDLADEFLGAALDSILTKVISTLGIDA